MVFWHGRACPANQLRQPKVEGSNPPGHTYGTTTYDDSGSHQRPLAHALPTFHVEDPDLALIVGLWDRLADECKQRMIEMVRANLPRQGDADEFDEINERGN